MALTAQQKVDIRRHLKVPASGVPGSQYTSGLRTILVVGQLESYMSLLALEDECAVTGYPYGVVRIWGNPAPGQTVSVNINGRIVTYTVQPSDLRVAQPLASIAGGLATAINLAGVGVQAATGSISTTDLPPAAPPQTGQVSIMNPTTFILSASATGLAAFVDPGSNGQTFPSPGFTSNAGVPQIYGYLPICNYLEGRIGQEDAFISFERADVVTFRKYAIERREHLYQLWCDKLGTHMSVGPNPAGNKGMGAGFGLIA